MTDDGKATKESVDYGNGKADHCGVCRFYIKVTNGSGYCVKVKGVIQPWKWCKLFKRRHKDAAQVRVIQGDNQ